MFRPLLLAASTMLVFACSAIPSGDLRTEYGEMVRKLGLTPIYPPSEEFQVGDVYLVSYDTTDPSDVSQRLRYWLGSLDSLRVETDKYLASRVLFDTTRTKDTERVIEQTDFTATGVTTSVGKRTSLPLVSFPSISGASETALAFGGFGFDRSFGGAFGRAEQVTLDFTDTRAYGLPQGAIPAQQAYFGEVLAKICPNLGNARAVLTGDLLARFGVNYATGCSGTRKCEFQILTRTYLTREIEFTYASARIARLAAAAIEGGGTTTATLPGDVNVNINLADGADATGATAALAAAVAGLRNETAETEGLSFSGLTARGLVFDRTFRKPVTIAYESLSFSDPVMSQICAAGGSFK